MYRILKTILIIFIQLTLVDKAACQLSEEIRSDRPGQAIDGFTPGKNALQFQQGIEYFLSNNDSYDRKGFSSSNTIRFGLGKNTELGASVDYRFEMWKMDSSISRFSGIDNLQLGFRVHFNDQKKWIPATGFQLGLKFPGLSTDYPIQNLAPIMTFVSLWSLPRKMQLNTNWVLVYNGNSPVATGKYVINYTFSVYKKWSGFIENYGQLSGTVFQTNFDGGFMFLLSNNIQFDFSAGFGYNQRIPDYFVSTGVSYRPVNFKENNKK